MSDESFLTTQWTRVVAAKGVTDDARSALGELSKSYYAPLVAFLRKEGRSEDDARELAHGFFAWLLSRDALATLEPRRGRFRTYLLGALKHFLSHEREKARAQKRGNQITHLPLKQSTETSPGLDPADPLSLPPDREFDRQWALHLIREAMSSLQSEWVNAGKEKEFLQLRPFLDGNASRGDLSTLAQKTAQNENPLRTQLHRLRRNFRKHLNQQITTTIPQNNEVTDELQELLHSL
jgi:RNA polymerase sigma-70 factor (ECF subfamily)